MGKNNAKKTLTFFLLILTLSTYIAVQTDYSQVLDSGNRLSECDIRFSTGKAGNIYVKESDKEIDLLDFVVIYSNMSTVVSFVATKNNSILYARTHIFIRKVSNYTIRVNSYIVENKLILKDKNTTKLIVVVLELDIHFLVIVKWINSFRDVEDIERERIGLITITNYDLYRYAIAGIPATFLALVIAYFVILIRKKLQIKEGLPDAI